MARRTIDQPVKELVKYENIKLFMLSLRKDKNYSMTRQINDNVDRPEKSSGQVEPMTFKSSV